MTDPWCCYTWCSMDPINIPPMLAYVSIYTSTMDPSWQLFATLRTKNSQEVIWSHTFLNQFELPWSGSRRVRSLTDVEWRWDGTTQCDGDTPPIREEQLWESLGPVTNTVPICPICSPWCCYIYLHDWVIFIFRANVGIHIPAPWFASGFWKAWSFLRMRSSHQNLVKLGTLSHGIPGDFWRKILPQISPWGPSSGIHPWLHWISSGGFITDFFGSLSPTSRRFLPVMVRIGATAEPNFSGEWSIMIDPDLWQASPGKKPTAFVDSIP